ncbi:MAG: CPBP family intramembrane glutamic endopeptidase [Chitinophagaceae bacterium]
MNAFLSYIREFIRTIHPGLTLFCFGFAALLVFLNYRYAIEPRVVNNIPNRLYRFLCFYLVYLTAFAIPYLVLFAVKGKVTEWKSLLLLVLVAPGIFALKVSFVGISQIIQDHSSGIWGRYAAIVANLPSKLLVVLLPLYIVWRAGRYGQPFFGLTVKQFEWSPYLLMLLIMIPLIAWAATQPDFLHTYPKLKQVRFIGDHTRNPWLYNLMFEIAYGIDFITIELFFRGFLVLAFLRFAGPEAILPMAVFYCSIHFGKPLAECISSFFGGLLLGLIVYQTRSIMGGLIVHLGIAWMMEIGGYLGHVLRSK